MARKKTAKIMKQHHKIHASYIVIIILILIIATTLSGYLIKNSVDKKVIVQQVYYKEIQEMDNSKEVELNSNVIFIDENCNLGKNLVCESIDIKSDRIEIWASHRLDEIVNITIQSPICSIKSEVINLEKWASYGFSLGGCSEDIADEKGVMEIPVIITIDGKNEKIELGQISTVIN